MEKLENLTYQQLLNLSYGISKEFERRDKSEKFRVYKVTDNWAVHNTYLSLGKAREFLTTILEDEETEKSFKKDNKPMFTIEAIFVNKSELQFCLDFSHE